ncbi:MAG: winged helix DNA-binding domain-containing protein, partial [Candidatus Moranbacteria bacterium]|nr:winged helix DNA-binding domain-containing protein [Candidatus Moranbacteria bacterium]
FSKKESEGIREIIKDKGPVSSLDIEFNEKVNWWWAPTKIGRAALESMYFWGELVVHNKINTRKYYDFSHRHIDGEILEAPDPNTDDDSFYNWYVLRRISAVGMLQNRASDAWLGINGMKSAERNRAFQNLIENKSILEINTEINTKPFFINSKSMDILEKSISGSKRKKRVSFLAPLDNLLWDRKLIKEIFDFEYVWEVYKPVSQRQYGYYVLPVLFGNDFVARFEPVRNRKNSTLEIKNWWWEKSFGNMKKSEFDNFKKEFNSALIDFMKYLETDRLIISDICRAEKIIDWVDL